MRKKVLKTWMGVVTGSLGGRDDGYPIAKCHVFESLEDAVLTSNEREKFYRLVRIPEKEIAGARRQVRENRKRDEKASLQRQAVRIRKRLRELE